MPGGFTPPEQIQNKGRPTDAQHRMGWDILGDLIDELENNGLYF